MCIVGLFETIPSGLRRLLIIQERALTFGIDVEWQVDDLEQGDGVEDKEQDTARHERDSRSPPPSALPVGPRPVVALYCCEFHFILYWFLFFACCDSISHSHSRSL